MIFTSSIEGESIPYDSATVTTIEVPVIDEAASVVNSWSQVSKESEEDVQNVETGEVPIIPNASFQGNHQLRMGNLH